MLFSFLMEKHILLIDPLDKLNISKDSSLFLATNLQQLNIPVYILFKTDLFYSNTKAPTFNVYKFTSESQTDCFYTKYFSIAPDPLRIELDPFTTLHMRLDPPFNLEYLQTLWILQSLKTYGVRIINDSHGILSHNEKLYAYSTSSPKIPSYLGNNKGSLLDFLLELKSKLKLQPSDEIVLKPVDLFQGEGVIKLKFNPQQVVQAFEKMTSKYKGHIVVQPFVKDVAKGEIRSLFFCGEELGSILKIPPKNSFLANIAQGAKYQPTKLSSDVKLECQRLSQDLANYGVLWLAFDILGGAISEVNITCPGLLTEVSTAHNENLALRIANKIAER